MSLLRKEKLKLNESLTEIMLIKVNLRTNVTPEFENLDVEASTLTPVNTAQNFGVSFDSELSFKSQIDMLVKNCSFQIHNYSVRICLDQKFLHVLVHSLVIYREVTTGFPFVSLPSYLLKKLQLVRNRSCRLIYYLPSCVPTTAYLIKLH